MKDEPRLSGFLTFGSYHNEESNLTNERSQATVSSKWVKKLNQDSNRRENQLLLLLIKNKGDTLVRRKLIVRHQSRPATFLCQCQGDLQLTVDSIVWMHLPLSVFSTINWHKRMYQIICKCNVTRLWFFCSLMFGLSFRLKYCQQIKQLVHNTVL